MRMSFGPLLAVVAALPLAGCQSLSLFHLAHAQRPAAPAVAASQYTDLGRQQLDRGQTGAAIESFQLALAVGENPAAAVNGLGVAYSRLGRLDAADVLFAKAALLDPSDERYARNLARVEASRDALAQATAEPVRAAPPSLAAAEPQRPGQILRASPWEVKIQAAAVTAPTARLPIVASRADRANPAPDDRTPAARQPNAGTKAAAADGQRLAYVDPRFKPLVRVALGASSTGSAVASRAAVQPGFVPLARIQLADMGVQRSGKSKVIVIAQR